MLFAVVADNARLRVSDFAAAGQLHEQKAAGALESDAPQRTTRPRSRTAVQAARSMSYQKRLIAGCAARHSCLKDVDFVVSEAIRLEFPPGVQAARVAECQIASFADTALRRCFRVGAGRHAEDLAGRLAVGLVPRIARCVITAIGVELPVLAGDPRQHPGFNAAEIRADEHVAGRRNDHAAGAVADHRQRLRIQLTHMFIVAGGDGSDGGIDIFDDRSL